MAGARGTQGKSLGGEDGDAGRTEDVADSLAFILRAMGSCKPERKQRDPSGCRREGEREAGICSEDLAIVQAR